MGTSRATPRGSSWPATCASFTATSRACTWPSRARRHRRQRGYFGGSFAAHAAVFYAVLTLLVSFTGFVQWAAAAARKRDDERRTENERALLAATARLNEQVHASDLHRTAAEARSLKATGHLEEAHRRRAEAEARLIEGTRQLRHLLRTLPPTTALTMFDDIELQAQDVVTEFPGRS